MRSEVAQSCASLCYPKDCSLPGFSIHGIFQARVLKWVAISFTRGSSQLGGLLHCRQTLLLSEPPGKFHAKMGTIKDRNGRDLTEAEDIKKRWQEYTELYKKRSS